MSKQSQEFLNRCNVMPLAYAKEEGGVIELTSLLDDYLREYGQPRPETETDKATKATKEPDDRPVHQKIDQASEDAKAITAAVIESIRNKAMLTESKQVLEDFVAELEPIEGWFKEDTGETITLIGVWALKQGIPVEDVTNHLDMLVSAVRNEYGD